MFARINRGVLAALAVVAIATGISAAVVFAHPWRDHGRHHESSIAHVLLISVDGLHQSDLEWYVSHHPGSELAKLAGGGAEYAGAQTPIPSDSFPGMVAQVTGGNPRTTGIYYDDEYSHAVLPAGTTSCHGQPTGGEVIYDSPDDKNLPRSMRPGSFRPAGQHPRNDLDATDVARTLAAAGRSGHLQAHLSA